MSLFVQFAQLSEALAATTKKLIKRSLIADYLRALPIEDAGRAALWLSGTPFAETDARVLNIGGSLLSKAIAQLAANGNLSAAYRRHGDLGGAAADLLAAHASLPPTLTLSDIEAAFTQLADARGPTPKLRLLLELLTRATPLEAKYLIKLATGDMRTGVKQSLVEEAIADAWPLREIQSASAEVPRSARTPEVSSPAASVRRASMLLGDIREVVAHAAAGTLDQARMKLFHPIGFMLASPVQSVEEAIARFTEEIAEEGKISVILSEGRTAAAVEGSAFAASADGHPVALSEAPQPGSPASATPADAQSKDQPSEEQGFGGGSADPDFSEEMTPAPPALRAAQLEDKYDGIRAQLHIDGKGRAALYSRNREDLSPSFPDLIEAFAAIEEPAILDGEILAWNIAAARALPFAALQQRLGRKRVTEEMRRTVPAALVVFDILYRGDSLLLEHPLSDRRKYLEAFAARWSSATADPRTTAQATLFGIPSDTPPDNFPRLILASATRLTTAAELDTAYEDARARGNEGVMIKSLASLYQPGRRGLAWLKLKRTLATLDVVVTGAEYGNGRRAQVLSDYTFAIRDTEDCAPDGTPTLKNVGKAYSGLTDQEIAELTAFFRAHTLEDNGHFRTVQPILVLEVAFNNVMRSTRHASGFALRFPRILRIRTDKPVAEIDTLRRVEEIYNSQPDKPVEPD